MGLRIAIVAVLLGCSAGQASTLEIFARGAASKNFLDSNSFVVSVSGATGLALTLIPRVRLEGRYTHASSLQNRLQISAGSISGTLNDIMTETAIYSVGMDIDLLGPRSSFQPFIHVGAGYVHTTRSYYFLEEGGAASVYLRDPIRTGISVNGGLGFRLRIANSFAFEVEAFAYGMDIHLPDPLINVLGSVGIRLFI